MVRINATVSDAVKSLLAKDLLTKSVEPADARSFRLKPSARGRRIVRKLKGFGSEVVEPLQAVGAREKQIFLECLMAMILELHQKGVIQSQRMCYTCAHFEHKKPDGFYCALLGRALERADLRLDCPEHQTAESRAPG